MRKILLLALLGILSLSLFGCYEKNNLYKELDTEKAEKDEYLDLSAKRTGIIGWLFDYNPLDHSTATRAKAYNNTVSLNEKLNRYNCYVKV